jgi:ubiquinone/menaquinone biosynthesis C-methylase UbiE
MTENKEKEIKKFFNKRIQVQGDKSFSPDIGARNDSGYMILDFLKNNLDAKKKILDAGCGEGRFSKYFIEKGVNITSMDFSEEYVRLAKKKIGKGKFIVGSVTKLPFKDKSFDYIFSVDVLQHVPDLKKAIREFHRVLKKGGVLIVIDKNKFGVHRKYLIPHRLIQKCKEMTGWRYSGFRERWFSPKKFREELAKRFKEAKFEYLMEKNKSKIFKTFPKLNFFVAWTAKK